MARQSRLLAALAALSVFAVGSWAAASYIEEEFSPRESPARPIIAPGAPHVPELARYLERLDLAEPLVCGRLAVVPVARRAGALEGAWLTMDRAIAENVLVVTEKGGGSVPVVVVENRSATHHVFIMAGEVVAGGKQTRTVRQDVVLAPGQQVNLGVFCIEAHRWNGKA